MSSSNRYKASPSIYRSVHYYIAKHSLSRWQYACSCHLRFRKPPESQFFTRFYFPIVFKYLPDGTCFWLVTARRICNSGIFSNQFFLFLIKRISVLNQNIFYFESAIVSDCVSNSSRANSIVGVKTSNPIILELKPDPGRDRPTLGPSSNFPWLKILPVHQ